MGVCVCGGVFVGVLPVDMGFIYMITSSSATAAEQREIDLAWCTTSETCREVGPVFH